MKKALFIVMLAGFMALGTTVVTNADDPPGGQSGSQLNSLDSRSGSPSEDGKTGIGSTSGSDAGVNPGLKSATQPVPCQKSTMRAETDTASKADPNMSKSSSADAAREAMGNVKKSDAETSGRMSADC